MVQTSEGRRWLDRAAAGIRSRPDREAVRAELEAHLEDKTADLVRIFPDLGRQEAERQAVEQMGDAEEIGKELARLHRPWPRYLWQASRVLLTAGLLWLLAIGMFRGDDAYLGDDHRSEWWDMDGLPGTAVMGDCDDIRYLPGGDPDQILTLEPCLTASVNGQKISLLRAALWQREDGRQGLYCYLRVDTWRFWERGRLREEWMTVTDSTGAVCGLGPDSPEDPETGGLLNGMSQMGFGPFHSGYELYLEDWDPESEWVRLDYGPGSPIFTFTVDLEEERA